MINKDKVTRVFLKKKKIALPTISGFLLHVKPCAKGWGDKTTDTWGSPLGSPEPVWKDVYTNR